MSFKAPAATNANMLRMDHYGRFALVLAAWLSRNFRIQVMWTKSGPPCCTSDGKIYMPMMEIKSEDDKRLFIGLVLHEGGHARFTDFRYVPNGRKTPLLHSLSNILEDVRMEGMVMKTYPGAAPYFRHTVATLRQTGYLEDPAKFPDAEPVAMLQAFMLYRLRCNILGQTAISDFADTAERLLKQALPVGLVVRLQALMFEVERCKDTKDVLVLAKKIPRMLEEEAEQEPEDSDADGEGDTDGEEGDGTAQGKSTGDGDEEGEGQRNVAPTGSGSGGGDGNQDPGTVQGSGRQHSKGDDAQGQSQASDKQKEAIKKILNMGEDEIQKGFGEVLKEHAEQASNQTPDSQKILPATETNTYMGEENATEIIGRASRPAGALMQRMAALMQAKTMADMVPSRSGKEVSTKRLARLQSGDTRIFTREIPGMKVDTAVMILVDKSGSMMDRAGNGQTLLQVALDCAMAAGLALDRVPGVVTSVAAFPAMHGTDIVALTRFGESVRQTARRYPNMHPSGSTPLAESLAWCIGEMAVLPQPRKLLIVLTDGAPDNRHGAQQMLKMADDLHIETMGIGINHDLSHLIADHRVVTNVNELPGALFGMLQRALSEKATA